MEGSIAIVVLNIQVSPLFNKKVYYFHMTVVACYH